MAEENKIVFGGDSTAAVDALDKLTAAEARTAKGAAIAAGAAEEFSAESVAAYQSAQRALEKFEREASAGSYRAGRSLGVVNTEVEKLEKQIQELRAQGKPTEALEQGLDRLRDRAAGATRQLGEMRAKLADAADLTRRATREAGEFSGSITDVQGTIKTYVPKLGDMIDKYSVFAAKAFAVVHVLSLVTGGLKALTDRTIDGESATKEITSATDNLAKSLLSLDPQKIATEFLNFVGTIRAATEGLYDNNLVLGELTKRNKELVEAWKAAKSAQDDLIHTNEAQVKGLAAQSTALIRLATDQKAAGEVEGWLKDKIRETLNAYEQRGEKAPEGLREIAKELNLLTKAEQDAADKSKKASEERIEQGKKELAERKAQILALKTAIEGDEEAVNKKTEAILAAIDAVREDGIVTKEATENIKASIQEQLDAYDKLGIAADERLLEIAKGYGVVSSAQEKFLDGQKALNAAIEEGAKKLVAIQDEIIAKQRELDEAMLPKTDIFGNALGTANKSAEELLGTLKRLRGEPLLSEQQRAELEAAEDAFARISQTRTPLPGQGPNPADSPQVQKLQGELDKLYEQEEALDGTINALEVQRDTAGDAATAQKDFADATDSATDSVSRFTTEVRTLADGTQAVVQVTKAAGDGLGGAFDPALAGVEALGEGLDGLGDTYGETVDGVESGSEQMKDGLGKVAEGAEDAAEGVDKLADAAERLDKQDKAGGLKGMVSDARAAREILADIEAALERIAEKSAAVSL